VGVQVPAGDQSAWLEFLQGLSYDWVDESQNPVYKIFLGPVA
jgi:threonine dehydratase